MKRSRGVVFAFASLAAAGVAFGGSWDERVFEPGSHLDFNAIASAGPSALPALIDRGRVLFKAKFTTVDGAGRPKATQAIIPTKVKNGVNPPFSRTSGPDSNSCFGCHNDPVEGGAGDDVANVFVSEGFESAQFDSIDPVVLERAAYDRANGRGPDRASGARDDRRLAGDTRRGGRGSLRDGQGRACRPGDEGRTVRLDCRPPERHRRPRRHRGRRLRPHRQAVQPQGRVHVAPTIHHQCAQHPPRHGGGRTLRRPMDRQPRFCRERGARRDHRRRRLGPGRVPGDPCPRRRSRPICPTTGDRRRARARRLSTRSAAPRATWRPCR